MKKTLMAAAFALAGAGFALPTQASAAALTQGLANGATADSSMAVQVRDHYRGRRYSGRGYRPRYAYRHWHHRPHYGRVVGGIALGALLAGSVYAYSRPPAPGLCWYWADPYERHGYWDYC